MGRLKNIGMFLVPILFGPRTSAADFPAISANINRPSLCQILFDKIADGTEGFLYEQDLMHALTGLRPVFLSGDRRFIRDRSVAVRSNDHDTALKFLKAKVEELGFKGKVKVFRSQSIKPLSESETYGEIEEREREAHGLGTTHRLPVQPLVLKNLEITVPGSQPRLGTVVIGAHYDTQNSLGGWKGATDTYRGTPGADDNGSGVVTVMSILKTLRDHTPKRTVKIVFIDGEEGQGQLINYKYFDGSRGWLASLSEQERSHIKVALLVDMIGSVPQGANQAYNFSLTGTRKVLKDLSSVVRQSAFYYEDVEAILATPHSDAYIGNLSDTKAFSEKGIPNILVSNATTHLDLPPHYHSERDDIHKIDWVRYQRLNSMLTDLALILANP